MKAGSVAIQRKREMNKTRRCIIGTVLAAFILLLMIVLGVMKITAQTARADERLAAGTDVKADALLTASVKAYKSVRVETQDCLWTIAKREMGEEWTDIRVYIDEVREINGITGDHLTAGAYVILPYYIYQ